MSIDSNGMLAKLLEEHQPELFERIRSNQYQKSNELLNLRLDNKLSISELCKIINMNEEDYLNFEFGEHINNTVEDYEKLLKIVNQNLKYIKKDGYTLFDSATTLNISDYLSKKVGNKKYSGRVDNNPSIYSEDLAYKF